MSLTRRFFLAATPMAAAWAARGSGAWAESIAAGAGLAGRRDPLPQGTSRLIMHWYIFGPAWTANEAVRQLRLMHDAHVGGVLIFPTYPVAVDDPARGIENHRYLSQEFLDVLAAVLAEAQRLGMTADMVIGTGWPYGGPSVTRADAAHALRMRRGDGVSAEHGEELIASVGAGADQLVFYSAPTGMQVKRAALGGEGPVLDHYQEGALTRYLDEVAGTILRHVPRGSLRAFFCDSLEVYRANWTAGMPAEFEARRGYDLRPHLPALFDSAHADARDVRCDFWRTCSELAVDAFLKPLHAWTSAHGVEIQVEAYGTPPVNLTGYRHVDLPVGEHYEWKEFSTSRWASSGAHLAGKRLVLAEAWTWAGLPNRFADTLEQLKLCSDLHFLCGINALYGVTYAYSPIDLGAPGWPPYFGPVVNHTQPYWPYMSGLSDYVARASDVLQRGRAVNDVLLYLPEEDCMAEAGPEQLLLNWVARDRLSSLGQPPEFSLPHALHYEAHVITSVLFSGFGLDGIDTFALNSGTTIIDGRLHQGDGRYALVILPNLTAIDPTSLDLLAAFVEAGGTLVATRRLPERAWGLSDRERRSERVRMRIQELFGTPAPREALRVTARGRGRSIFVRDEQGSLQAALRQLTPDVDITPPTRSVGFVHRETETGQCYFLANTSADPQDLDVTFRDVHPHAARWDLVRGRRTELPRGVRPRSWRVPLAPYESCAIVFDREPSSAPVRTWPVETDGTHVVRWQDGASRREVRGLPAPRALDAGWTLATKAGTERRLETLRSWTDLEDLRFFSGVGRYEIAFELPALRKGLRVRLDLGRVHETADVFVNADHAGLAWMRPFTLDITPHVTPGINRLRVDVSNTLLNKVLGDGPIDYSALVSHYGDRFPWGDEWTVVREPQASGLLGPVTLVFLEDLGDSGR